MNEACIRVARNGFRWGIPRIKSCHIQSQLSQVVIQATQPNTREAQGQFSKRSRSCRQPYLLPLNTPPPRSKTKHHHQNPQQQQKNPPLLCRVFPPGFQPVPPGHRCALSRCCRARAALHRAAGPCRRAGASGPAWGPALRCAALRCGRRRRRRLRPGSGVRGPGSGVRVRGRLPGCRRGGGAGLLLELRDGSGAGSAEGLSEAALSAFK